MSVTERVMPSTQSSCVLKRIHAPSTATSSPSHGARGRADGVGQHRADGQSLDVRAGATKVTYSSAGSIMPSSAPTKKMPH